MTSFPHLFRPLPLAPGVRASNRFYFAPMGIDMAHGDGRFSDDLLTFYRGLLDGGCGMLILSNATISPLSRLHSRGLCLYDRAHAESLKVVFDLAANYDAVVGIQLQHYGGQGTTVLTGTPVWTPSGIPCKRASRLDPYYATHEMTIDDIRQVVREFGNAAALGRSAGARLIQLQASNGYLLGSFLSPYTNHRRDAYGGSDENRARLLMEVVAVVRQAIGDDAALTVRLGIDDRVGDAGLTPDKVSGTVRALEEAGIDALTCSMCIGETFGQFLTYSAELDRHLQASVKYVKSQTRLPVGFAGYVGDLHKAESLLVAGVADFIGASRALFADNDLITKTLAGREDEIHRCLWDGKCFADKSNPAYDRVYCCVNPKYRRPELADRNN
jgi:2,4-dienoyl-CoA reductase-like NADH-dependent reductase (Old Yellow Enzyme family)